MTRGLPNPAGQQGAALLIALLAVALAALMAVGLIERSQRDLARTGALVSAERSWQLAAGLEGLARDWIRQQRESGLASEMLDGRWAAPFPVPGGVVRGRVFDLGGRFNLNRLAHRDPATAARARLALSRLLAHLNLDPALAEQIVSLVPAAAAGAPVKLAHISELDRLPSLSAGNRELLRRYLVVLPDPGARLNLNRAEAEVLAAMVDGLDLEAARRLLGRRPFGSIDDALSQPELQNVNSATLSTRLSVASDWFLAQAQVTLDGEVRDYYRLISASSSGYDFRYMSQGIP
ncbi:MAG: type II secretion system minor pseudopilin GspK [Wenzhouxiangellaceae bacterium]|nr:type II secretion system minor pseudopilin GspK [Wenzhouxiangellaceae bacterium]